MPADVAIVGAGLSGLVAARRLSRGGIRPMLVEQRRAVGGRLATAQMSGAVLDHGAQFFTVRGEPFASFVAGAAEAGPVYEWCRGFGEDPDGYPRYAVNGGMNALAHYLAEPLEPMLSTRVVSASVADGRWILSHGGGELTAEALLLTAPLPQSLRLLDAGGVSLEPSLRVQLDAVDFQPTLAFLAVLDGPSAVAHPGGLQLGDGPFSFVADNRAKGISERSSFTGHLNHALSAELWGREDSLLEVELAELARPFLGDAEVVATMVRRWRHAGPRDPLDAEMANTECQGAMLVLAGDAFAGAKVEGAYRSGHAAAEVILAALGGK